jgi:uncharacterized protein YdhG (YjbR/CyaY superfamily)
MAKTDYKTIDEYHKAHVPESRARMQRIREIVHEIVPDAEETISYQIPCFKYKGYLIYYAAFAKHISLSNPFSEAFLKRFSTDLKKYKVSKAAIQLPADAPLPEELIKRIIKFRKEENDKAKK